MIKTWMPTVAGILSIIAGAIGFLGGLAIGFVASVFLATSSYPGFGVQNFGPGAVWAALLPLVIICIVAIVGGVFALQRRVWGLALAGAICALLTVWGWPLGVAAIVLVVLSKHEFGHVAHVQPPLTPPPPPAAG